MAYSRLVSQGLKAQREGRAKAWYRSLSKKQKDRLGIEIAEALREIAYDLVPKLKALEELCYLGGEDD